MTNPTDYARTELTRMARHAVAREAAAAKCRARYIGWHVRIGNHSAQLVAVGERLADAVCPGGERWRFETTTAL